MSERQQEPTRLFDPSSDASSALRAAIGAARAEGPSPAALGRIAAGISTKAAVGSTGLALKIVVAVVAVGAGGVLATSIRDEGAPPIVERSAPVLPDEGARVIEPPSLADSSTITAALDDRAPNLATRRPRRARVLVAPPSGTSEPSIEAELQLLESARAKLESDPKGAFEIIRRHESDFPQGTFVQEREVIAIEALLRLGRGAKARERLSRFNLMFEQSAHRVRLESLLNAE